MYRGPTFYNTSRRQGPNTIHTAIPLDSFIYYLQRPCSTLHRHCLYYLQYYTYGSYPAHRHKYNIRFIFSQKFLWAESRASPHQGWTLQHRRSDILRRFYQQENCYLFSLNRLKKILDLHYKNYDINKVVSSWLCLCTVKITITCRRE